MPPLPVRQPGQAAAGGNCSEIGALAELPLYQYSQTWGQRKQESSRGGTFKPFVTAAVDYF